MPSIEKKTTTEKFEEALANFKQALKADPSNEDARYNYEMVKKKLAEQKKKEEDQKKKDPNKQDKNEDQKKEENKACNISVYYL